MTGMKFKRSCVDCSTTFFTHDRRNFLCPKCQKKRNENRPKVIHVRRADAASLQPRSRRPGPDARTNRGGPGARRRPAAPKKAKPPKPPKPPKLSELTPELRERIATVYREVNREDVPLRIINAQISEKVWAKRHVVMQVVSELRGLEMPLHTRDITPEHRATVITQFESFFRECSRPEKGRHRAIAEFLGLPVNAVRRIRREWIKQQIPPEKVLSRDQLFVVEKEYWNELKRRALPLEAFPETIAARTGLSAFQIMLWIDQLHDENSGLKALDVPSDEAQARIVAEYREYLDRDTPPAESLHKSLAELTGITPEQVHKVLVNYRIRNRAAYTLS